jgi:hypothetical protein
MAGMQTTKGKLCVGSKTEQQQQQQQSSAKHNGHLLASVVQIMARTK